MIAADLLAVMNILDNELEVQGVDEHRCLTALSMAQRMFEAIIANHQDVLGTADTITTTPDQDYTDWPSSLLRLDQLMLLDDLGRQRWPIVMIQEVGGQTPSGWPLALAMGLGAPTSCYTNRSRFFWDRIPDIVYPIRTYGLQAKLPFTTSAQVFGYPDHAVDPMATVAVQCLEMGIDDPSTELNDFADKIYKPVIRMLKNPVRQRPASRQYAYTHST